jgi:MFS family permease
MTPLNGRVSDIVGRKPMVSVAIIVFCICSALCGAAKNMTWFVARSVYYIPPNARLIAARAFQGMGGGSIVALT